MTAKALPTPPGYEGATPYLCIAGAAEAIEFYKKSFGAVEIMRLADPSGKVDMRIRSRGRHVGR
jgi:PhnB protein